MNRSIRIAAMACVLSAAFALPVALAQTTAAETGSQTEAGASPETPNAQRALTIRKLQTIKAVLNERRELVRNLLEQLDTADDLEKDKLRSQITDLQQTIRELTDSFERTALKGVNLQSLDETGQKKFDWREELAQIARPVLDSLKNATEKPRRMAELQASIELHRQHLETTKRALEAIAELEQYGKPQEVAEAIAEVASSWRRRKDEIEHVLSAAQNELRFLESEENRIFETIGSAVYEFILGRGLTLVLALTAGIVLWYLMRALRRLLRRKQASAGTSGHAAKIRLLAYGYHLLTIILVALAVLSVFYVRGDVLLLSLAIIALVMLALGVWRFLPGYVREARLLLNAGAVREGERVIYNGLPLRIDSLNLYSELRNPELEGTIRLPLSALSQLVSRPLCDEDWFPCRRGDYLLLPDSAFAQVLQQTVEFVRLKVVGSVVQFASADFLQLNVQNLSREGFGVVVTFGIDYQHQAISLDRVPERLRAGLTQAFGRAELEGNLNNLVVDFSAANASSLDYLIYATLDGACASSYFSIKRLIQQTCVDICNQEGWTIPFTQVTVHQA